MAFDVTAEAYGRFMGRFSEPLAGQLADLAEIRTGSEQRVVDVGCGPGALTAELVRRLGVRAVAAVDPSEPFVAAARDRLPGVDVRRAAAEELPYPDDAFDTALAQLAVHFMADPVAGLREMARVTRSGGVVAACVWDFAGERAPLTTFWRAAGQLDDATVDESGRAGARAGHLAELAEAAGLLDVEPAELTVQVTYPTFEDWWEPYTLGVGPAGDHVTRLDDAGRAALRARCADLLPQPPIDVAATAWAVRAIVA
jgi:ubiquinone/menaquinone biosynthesis C-methylase UbiE